MITYHASIEETMYGPREWRAACSRMDSKSGSFLMVQTRWCRSRASLRKRFEALLKSLDKKTQAGLRDAYADEEARYWKDLA